jgi:hypothetical protein
VQRAYERPDFNKYVSSRSIARAESQQQKVHKYIDTKGNFCFRDIDEPLEVSFTDLTLSLKESATDSCLNCMGKVAKKKILLNNVFGCLKPFQITALMGPSGTTSAMLRHRKSTMN